MWVECRTLDIGAEAVDRSVVLTLVGELAESVDIVNKLFLFIELAKLDEVRWQVSGKLVEDNVVLW